MRAKTKADLHPVLHKAELISEGSLQWNQPTTPVSAKPSFPLYRPAAVSLLLLAINKLRVFNKLMSARLRGAGRCVLGDISWRAAWQQHGAGREQAGSRGCVPLSWVFWQGGELVCLAGPSHLGSICVSLESDRRLQAVRNRRCAGPDTCPANERRRQAGLRLRSKITSRGGGRALLFIFQRN